MKPCSRLSSDDGVQFGRNVGRIGASQVRVRRNVHEVYEQVLCNIILLPPLKQPIKRKLTLTYIMSINYALHLLIISILIKLQNDIVGPMKKIFSIEENI